MDAKGTDALAQRLSEIYHPLEMKSFQILQGLQHRIFDPQLAYYSGHHRKSADGVHRVDYFPLPVITVDGFCDVVIDLDCVVVNSKLRGKTALSFTYEQLGAYEFEICGEDDDTIYHHHLHADTASIREAVLKSSEKNFRFSFQFNFDIDGDTIHEFVKLLRRKGFFIKLRAPRPFSLIYFILLIQFPTARWSYPSPSGGGEYFAFFRAIPLTEYFPLKSLTAFQKWLGGVRMLPLLCRGHTSAHRAEQGRKHCVPCRFLECGSLLCFSIANFAPGPHCAEDEAPIANLLRTALEGAGYRCAWAADGATAADLPETQPLDLALLDIMLPKANGYEMLEYQNLLGVCVEAPVVTHNVANRQHIFLFTLCVAVM